MNNNQSEASSATATEFQHVVGRLHDRAIDELHKLQHDGANLVSGIFPLREHVRLGDYSAMSILRFTTTRVGMRRGAFKQPDVVAVLGFATIEHPTVANDNERIAPTLCLYRHYEGRGDEPTILMRFDPVASPYNDEEWRQLVREQATAFLVSMR